jgi:hypothetical protein
MGLLMRLHGLGNGDELRQLVSQSRGVVSGQIDLKIYAVQGEADGLSRF